MILNSIRFFSFGKDTFCLAYAHTQPKSNAKFHLTHTSSVEYIIIIWRDWMMFIPKYISTSQEKCIFFSFKRSVHSCDITRWFRVDKWWSTRWWPSAFFTLSPLSLMITLFFLTYIIRFSLPLDYYSLTHFRATPRVLLMRDEKKDFPPLSIHPPKQLYSYTILGVNILTYDCKLNLCIVIFSGKNFNLIDIAACWYKIYMGYTHSICLALFCHKTICASNSVLE